MSEKESERLRKELKIAKKQAEEYLNGWKRAKADYINREKEIEKEKEEWIKFANLNLIFKLLTILDSLDSAINKSKDSDVGKNKRIFEGIIQIKKQFINLLKNNGVEKIKTIGEKYNPELHDVVEKRGEGGKIIGEVQSGYKMYDRVIRPAKVIVE